MHSLRRTISTDSDFIRLVGSLDQYLAERDGKDHAFYAQFNKIDMIRHVVLYYEDDEAVGCGAFKQFEPESVEIKRMFVQPEFRGQGIGALILNELEAWAGEIGYLASVLETGKKQAEAIQLYQKSGYSTIPNYGQYENVENSVCMKKEIAKGT